jgi:serine protease AprX
MVVCSFSSRGPCLNGRIKPDILAPGKNIMAARFLTTDQYWEMTGTSMATPFVAGLVALWLDYDLRLGNHGITDFNPEIKYILMGSAADVPGDSTPGKDNNYGAGRVDMVDSWMFVEDDISTGFSDAPLVLDYSWYE